MQQSPGPDVRRQVQRNPVRAHAFAHARGRFQPATVVDYSHGGLQLEGTFGLFKLDPVQIEFISGIRVLGQVAWSLGGRAGIAFSEGLPATHPAIVELARRAARSLNEQSIPHQHFTPWEDRPAHAQIIRQAKSPR
jgi:hypothetical protein